MWEKTTYGCDVGKERGEQGFNCAYLDMDGIKEWDRKTVLSQGKCAGMMSVQVGLENQVRKSKANALVMTESGTVLL